MSTKRRRPRKTKRGRPRKTKRRRPRKTKRVRPRKTKRRKLRKTKRGRKYRIINPNNDQQIKMIALNLQWHYQTTVYRQYETSRVIYIKDDRFRINKDILEFISPLGVNIHISAFFYFQFNRIIHRPHVSLHYDLRSSISNREFKIELHYGTDQYRYTDVRNPHFWIVISSKDPNFNEYPDRHMVEVINYNNTGLYKVQYDSDWHNTFINALEIALKRNDDYYMDERWGYKKQLIVKKQTENLKKIYENYIEIYKNL